MAEKMISIKDEMDKLETNSESKDGASPEQNINNEGVTSAGEARYQAVSQSITNAGGKISSWVKNGASRLGRLFKAGAVGVLSTPEAAVAGAQFVANKAAEGADFADKKIGEGADFVIGKIGQGLEFADQKAGQVYEFGSEQYENAKNFVSEKAGKVEAYARDKALLAEAVASLVVDKTAEKLNVAKEGVVNNYGKAVKFGREAIDSASLRCQKVKEGYNEKKNNFMKTILERKAQIHAEKLQSTLAKLSQYQTIAGLRT